MTVRDLIRELLDHPLDSQVYVGKGMGPLRRVDGDVAGNTGTDRIFVVLSPAEKDRPMLCTKTVPGPCQNEAAEILYAREIGQQEWETYPRCAGHPAADDVAMIKRISPLAETRMEKVNA
jgi:hypothetical protein